MMFILNLSSKGGSVFGGGAWEAEQQCGKSRARGEREKQSKRARAKEQELGGRRARAEQEEGRRMGRMGVAGWGDDSCLGLFPEEDGAWPCFHQRFNTL